MTIATLGWLLAACGAVAPTEITVDVTGPEQAVVFDGDRRLGETPYTVPLEEAPDTLTLKADGYAAQQVTVEQADVVVEMSKGCERLVGYDGRFAEQQRLTPEDVARVPAKRLALLRNEIFAQYGRPFKKDKIREHFESQTWYRENDQFSLDVLSAVDKANATLIKSFEGDKSDALLKRGQFTGQGLTLALVSESAAEVGDKGGDLYEWDRQERHWMAKGEWVITWEKPERFSPQASKARLWKVDIDKGTIEQTMPLKPVRG
jgi:hypothetical protein